MSSTSTQSLASYQRESASIGSSPIQSCGLSGPSEMVGGKVIQSQTEVPDLNAANFASKLSTVRNWWNLGVALLVLWNTLDEIERNYTTTEDRLKALYNYFVSMHPYPRWRCVIYGLDECGDTELADKIRSYAEPITDPTLTIENVVDVLKLMKSRWYNKMSHILAVPVSKKMKIKQQYSSEEDQLKAFVKYIHAFHPNMTWEMLAGVLHSMEENEALEMIKKRSYLKLNKDRQTLLTMENVRGIIKGIKNWHRFGWWLDVPLSKRDEIKANVHVLEEQVDSLINEFLKNHPCPSWELFAWALLRRREAPEHKMLGKLYGNYIPVYYTLPPEAASLKHFVKRVVKMNQILGYGAYGCVEVVLHNGEEFAAKRLRTDVRGQDMKCFNQRFRTEYDLLTSLRHKNIVSYKGLCYISPPDLADIPLLMMELLKIDLHRRLVDYSQEYPGPLTLQEKCSTLLDIAEGLDYLHTHKPPVIHRDLTAKNVLLDEEGTAKIADFGNSRMLSIDQTSCFETMTCHLGTPHYSAPEAYPATSFQSYNAKIDIFSFGHLALFVMIEEFPSDLLSAVQVKPDDTKEALSEKERRIMYMNKLEKVCENKTIPLHQMPLLITDCLDNRPQQRPSATELITRVKYFL